MKKQTYSDRDKLIIKLVAYLFFFFIIFAFIAGSGVKPQSSNKEETKAQEQTKEDKKLIPYVDKQEILKTGSYKYKFIAKNTDTIIYSGTSNNGKREGYKEASDGIIKYVEENGIVHSITVDSEVIYEQLYDGLDADVFNFTKLFDNLNVKKSLIERNGNETKYTYEDVNGYNIVILAGEKQIEKIEITGEEVQYNFTFEY